MEKTRPRGQAYLLRNTRRQNLFTSDPSSFLTPAEFRAVLLELEDKIGKEPAAPLLVPDQVIEHEVAASMPGISDLEVRDYYDRHPDQFMAPAEMTIREIVLLAESEADKANRRKEAERVRGRAVVEDFAAVAREVSDAETRLDGGLLGPLHEGDLGEPLESYALGMDAGQVSAVIVAPDGFHIIKLESRSEERLIPFDESIDRARTTLQNERYMEQLEAFVEMARGEAEWWVKAEYRDYLPEGGVMPTREEAPW